MIDNLLPLVYNYVNRESENPEHCKDENAQAA
jgi:hypothetical protein